MEQDREEVDLGIAADIVKSQAEKAPKQPKKRFVGRRQAAEAASRNGADALQESSKEIQGLASNLTNENLILTAISVIIEAHTANLEPSTT